MGFAGIGARRGRADCAGCTEGAISTTQTVSDTYGTPNRETRSLVMLAFAHIQRLHAHSAAISYFLDFLDQSGTTACDKGMLSCNPPSETGSMDTAQACDQCVGRFNEPSPAACCDDAFNVQFMEALGLATTMSPSC